MPLKLKFCITLKTKILESVLRVALEGPYDNVEAILIEAISLWINERKYRYLFARPEIYLNNGVDKGNDNVD
jgi:hypothetical protein